MFGNEQYQPQNCTRRIRQQKVRSFHPLKLDWTEIFKDDCRKIHVLERSIIQKCLILKWYLFEIIIIWVEIKLWPALYSLKKKKNDNYHIHWCLFIFWKCGSAHATPNSKTSEGSRLPVNLNSKSRAQQSRALLSIPIPAGSLNSPFFHSSAGSPVHSPHPLSSLPASAEALPSEQQEGPPLITC